MGNRRTSWNAGLTKETDERVKNYGKKVSKAKIWMYKYGAKKPK